MVSKEDKKFDDCNCSQHLVGDRGAEVSTDWRYVLLKWNRNKYEIRPYNKHKCFCMGVFTYIMRNCPRRQG